MDLISQFERSTLYFWELWRNLMKRTLNSESKFQGSLLSVYSTKTFPHGAVSHVWEKKKSKFPVRKNKVEYYLEKVCHESDDIGYFLQGIHRSYAHEAVCRFFLQMLCKWESRLARLVQLTRVLISYNVAPNPFFSTCQNFSVVDSVLSETPAHLKSLIVL